jgi:Flp pilus assembly protein TadD
MDRGDSASAVVSLRAAIALDPQDAEPHVNLGCALYSLREKGPSAAVSFANALEIDSTYLNADQIRLASKMNKHNIAPTLEPQED